MNPEYMKVIFHKTVSSTHRPFNLEINENHTIKYRNKSLRCLRPHVWNFLSNQIKKTPTTLSSMNLLTIGLVWSVNVICILF